MRYFSRETHIKFMGVRKPMMIISTLLVLGSIALLLTRGLNFGIDFQGGVLVEVGYPDAVVLDEVRSALNSGGFAGASVQFFGTSSDVLIRLAPEAAQSTAQISDEVVRVLSAGEPGLELRRIEFVGPQVGEELAIDGGLAALFALILILIYVAFRFEWKFSVGAVAATAHDAIIVMGLFSLLGLEFDLSVLAAVLAVIGYSLNDTVVVFDRVRENLRKYKKRELKEVLNLSINETLSRTVMTSVTTLIALISLYVLGGDVIRGFVFAMIWGVVVGTYSSVFIASTVLEKLGVKRDWSKPDGGAGTQFSNVDA